MLQLVGQFILYSDWEYILCFNTVKASRLTMELNDIDRDHVNIIQILKV